MRSVHEKLPPIAGRAKRDGHSGAIPHIETRKHASLTSTRRPRVVATLLLCLPLVLASGCGGKEEPNTNIAAEEPMQDASTQEEQASPNEEPELFSEQVLELFVTRYARGGANPLQSAVRDGYVKRVKQLLGAGWKADEESLFLASSQGDGDVVRLLLEGGAPPTGSLYAAVDSGYAEVVGLLLDAGAPADLTVNFDHQTEVALLNIAARKGYIEVVRLLLDAGAPVDIQTTYRETSLHSAARYGHREVVRLLLERGADVNAKYSQTALHAAAIHGDVEIAQLLLQAGAFPEVIADRFKMERDRRPSTNDATPLYIAAAHGNEGVVRLLLEIGVSVDVPDRFVANPMHAAVRARDAEIVRQLIEAGAAVHKRDNEGHFPIQLAASHGSAEITGLLLNAGAPAGMSAFVTAANLGHADVARLLINAGASVLEEDQEGNTMLHFAAGAGYPEVVELFISAGAPVDVRNNRRRTPLYYAVWGRDYLMPRTGTDREASREQRYEAIRLLIKAGAPLDWWYGDSNDNQFTLLHAAASRSPGVVEMLLEGGATLNVRKKNGDTPLHMAARNSHSPAALESIKLLLEAGASAGAKNNRGETPLNLAERNLEAWRLIKNWESS